MESGGQLFCIVRNYLSRAATKSNNCWFGLSVRRPSDVSYAGYEDATVVEGSVTSHLLSNF